MTNLSASQYRRLANKVSNQRRLVPGYETQLMRRLAPRTRGTQLTPHPGPYFPIRKPFGLSPSILQLRTILRTTFPQLYEIHQCRVLAYLYTLWSPPRSNTQRAAISGPKHGKHTIVKQSLFSKSIRTQILCKMLSLLGQAGKSTEKYRRGNLWGSDTKLHNLQNVLSILKYGCESTTALAIKHRTTVQSCMHADLCRISN